MKKYFLSTTLISFLFFSINASGSLQINPDNPYFIFSDGKFVFSWANNEHGVSHNNLASHGFNHYEDSVRWIDGRGEPLSGNRFPSDGNINFNEGWFDSLRSEIQDAANHGISVTIVLYGGPHFEGDRTPGSRFGQNPWNACLGGPIDIGTCPYQDNGEKSPGGFREFLTLENYDYNNPLTSQYSEYDKNWNVGRKVQYRQEELFNKFNQEIGDLDNWMYNMMWEINDNPDSGLTKKWAKWFAGYVHRIDSGRLVFTGEQSGAEYASSVQGIDGSQHEGIVSWGGGAYQNLRNIGSETNNKPKVVIGYDPWDTDGVAVDHLCSGGPGNIGAEPNIDFMRAAILEGHGVHPSTGFHFKNCGGEKQQIMDWVKVTQDFLETVDYWGNEPGDEITESTLPTYDNYKSFSVSANDNPDGDGKHGWPRHGGGENGCFCS